MQRYETQRRKAYIIRLAIAQLIITFVGMLAAYLVADVKGMSSVFKGALVAYCPTPFLFSEWGFFTLDAEHEELCTCFVLKQASLV